MWGRNRREITVRHLVAKFSSKRVFLAAIALGAPVWAVTIGILHVSAGRAQSRGETILTPGFEVASVRLSSQQEHAIGILTYPGGRLKVTNYTLRMLIQAAYGLQDFQIVGGPKWAGDERYSIVAKPPEGSISSKINPANAKLPPPAEELLMLRILLADRFRLGVHEETKEGPVLALVVDNQGPKLTEAKDKGAFPVVAYGRTGIEERPDYMHGINASMGLFAARLARELERPVLDETGLKGAFDFKLEYVKNFSEPTEGPSIFGALRQLGLKLLPTKRPVSHLVIDHAEKPSEN